LGKYKHCLTQAKVSGEFDLSQRAELESRHSNIAFTCSEAEAKLLTNQNLDPIRQAAYFILFFKFVDHSQCISVSGG